MDPSVYGTRRLKGRPLWCGKATRFSACVPPPISIHWLEAHLALYFPPPQKKKNTTQSGGPERSNCSSCLEKWLTGAVMPAMTLTEGSALTQPPKQAPWREGSAEASLPLPHATGSSGLPVPRASASRPPPLPLLDVARLRPQRPRQGLSLEAGDARPSFRLPPPSGPRRGKAAAEGRRPPHAPQHGSPPKGFKIRRPFFLGGGQS